MTPPSSLAIIGGGFTGLTAAFYAKRRCPELQVTLFEAANRTGGVIETIEQDGYLIEQSADSFLATDELPWARQLAIDLGLTDQLIEITPAYRRALVLWRRRLHPVPTGFQLMAMARPWSVWRSGLLSWRGKWRLMRESTVPPRVDAIDEESLEQFALRRVGQEVFDRLVQPLAAGIYTADASELSVDAALPRFVQMEREFGSLTRALQARDRHTADVSGARYARFLSLKRGLGQLIQQQERQLRLTGVRIETKMSIDRLEQHQEGRWRIAAGLKSYHADAVIVALPTSAAARLMQPIDRSAAELLLNISTAPVAVVCLGYRRKQVKRWPRASGFVVPAVEPSRLIAASFASRKFPQRAPEGSVLVRAFLGGAHDPQAVASSAESLCQLAHAELQPILGIEGEFQTATCARWTDASPHYTLGHQTRVQEIEDRLSRHAGLALAGNGYHGVGLPQCAHSALRALDRVRVKGG